jgi:hypothetical protein
MFIVLFEDLGLVDGPEGSRGWREAEQDGA